MRTRSVNMDVRTIYQDMPCSIRGFCFHDEDGVPFIVINARMSVAQQKQTYRHELRHIVHGDMFDPAYREYD